MYNSSSDSDDDEAHHRRQRVFRKRINFSGITDPFTFREKFRLANSTVEEVHRIIGSSIKHSTLRNFALSPMEQILLSLHWMGTGCQYHAVADMHGVYKSTVQRTLSRVVSAVLDKIFPAEVRFPDEPQALESCRQFFGLCGFPKIGGCVDGSLFPIDAPSIHEASFVDRKGNHSINAIVVCGPKLEFFYGSARWPGSVHDARVLRNCSLFESWESGWRPFPGAVLLGDSGYPLLEWLLTPICRNVNADALAVYLRKHKSTRRLVECALGVLKERFPCLNHMRAEVCLAAKIILACMALHNLEIKFNGEIYVPMEDGKNYQVDCATLRINNLNIFIFCVCTLDEDAAQHDPEIPEDVVPASARAVYEEFINYFERNM